MKSKVNITAGQALKSGVNPRTKKNWTLFKFTVDPITVDGSSYDSFTSFDSHDEGPTEVELEVNVNGQWKNLREVAPKSKVQLKLDELERRVTALEKRKSTYDDIPVVQDAELDL